MLINCHSFQDIFLIMPTVKCAEARTFQDGLCIVKLPTKSLNRYLGCTSLEPCHAQQHARLRLRTLPRFTTSPQDIKSADATLQFLWIRACRCKQRRIMHHRTRTPKSYMHRGRSITLAMAQTEHANMEATCAPGQTPPEGKNQCAVQGCRHATLIEEYVHLDMPRQHAECYDKHK
jgi:hypothetical protein